MKKFLILQGMLIGLFGALASCNTEEMSPVGTADPNSPSEAEVVQLFGAGDAGFSNGGQRHAVVQEVFVDGRYRILRVLEGSTERWLIARTLEVAVGDHLDFEDGLVKTNYRSTALNRVFDEVELVSAVVVSTHETTGADSHSAHVAMEAPEFNSTAAKGALSSAEVLKSAAKLNGQKVRVKGIVTKVNANIMKRHWVHISESSQGASDLVITTQTLIPVGHSVVVEGVLSVKKDFGAGYVFDVIVENAEVL